METIIRKSNEGRCYWVLGDHYRMVLTGEETGGAYALVEITLNGQQGPPLHSHRGMNEGFLVLEGSISVRLGSSDAILRAGSFANIPAGQPHTFHKISAERTRILLTIAPAGIENFFIEIGTPATDDIPPDPDPAVMENIMRLAPQYGLDLLL